MKGNPFKRHRHSIRLRGYDYSQQGAYFITIVTRNRECLFGDIVDGAVQWSPIGRTAHDYWYEISHHFTNVELDEFVVMPNHVHGIIVIANPSVQSFARINPP